MKKRRIAVFLAAILACGNVFSSAGVPISCVYASQSTEKAEVSGQPAERNESADYDSGRKSEEEGKDEAISENGEGAGGTEEKDTALNEKEETGKEETGKENGSDKGTETDTSLEDKKEETGDSASKEEADSEKDPDEEGETKADEDLSGEDETKSDSETEKDPDAEDKTEKDPDAEDKTEKDPDAEDKTEKDPDADEKEETDSDKETESGASSEEEEESKADDGESDDILDEETEPVEEEETKADADSGEEETKPDEVLNEGEIKDDLVADEAEADEILDEEELEEEGALDGLLGVDGLSLDDVEYIWEDLNYGEGVIEIAGLLKCTDSNKFDLAKVEFYLIDKENNEEKLGELQVDLTNPKSRRFTKKFAKKLRDGNYSLSAQVRGVADGETIPIAPDTSEDFVVDRNIPVNTIDGKKYKLSDIEDSQVVILVFGRSNSLPTQKTLENLNILVQKYDSDKIKTIFMDVDQEPDAVEALAKDIPYVDVCSQKQSGIDYEVFLKTYSSKSLGGSVSGTFIVKEGNVEYENLTKFTIEKEVFAEQLESLGIESIAQKLDFLIKTIDGNEYMLSSLSRSQAVLLLFGRSTCGNCQVTLKNLNELAEEYNKGDIRIIFMDVDQELEITKKFAETIPYIEVCNQKSSGENYNAQRIEYCEMAGGKESNVFPDIFIVKADEMVYSNTKGGVIGKNIFTSEWGKLGIKSFDTRRQEIKDFYKANPFSQAGGVSYKLKPVLKANAYEAGELDDKSVQNGLNALNFLRFAAGLPSVKNDKDYQLLAQKGTVVMRSLDEMTHTPEKPADMQEDFYQEGYKGTSQSNIAWESTGRKNLAYSVIQQWMEDGDESNIDQVGHRRWCLNPSMAKTGFGHTDGYAAMYSFDQSGSYDVDYVAWPAKVMPYEYLFGPWSVSLNGEEYDVEPDSIEVTLTMGKKSYKFSESDQENGYFHVDTGNYGLGPAVIFRPDAMRIIGSSVVDVSIAGVTDKKGNPKDISYEVKFFRMSPSSAEGGSSSGGSSGGGGGGSSSGGSSGGGGGGGSSSGGPGGGVVTPGSSAPGSLPSYVEKGEWSQVGGRWRFADASGNARANDWVAAYNPYASAGQQNYDWFRFDQNGDMITGWFTDTDGNRYYLNPSSDGTMGKMLTGWVWIADESGASYCYYFNPNSDGYRGKAVTNTVIDGYSIDANGRWTVNGVPQTK